MHSTDYNTDISSPNQDADLTAVSKKDKRIPVVEIFGPTIEGEGAIIGIQTMFIRFGLCDYACKMCDSKHAVEPKLVKALAAWRTQREIFDDMMELLEQKRATHIQHITFSGGNPAIHDLTELVELFKAAGKKIIVETQGTKHPKWLARVDHLVISPKSPGMGEEFSPDVFYEFLEHTVTTGVDYSIKIVIFSAQDIEFAAGVACLLHDMLGYVWQKQFFLSLGNPLPPTFAAVAQFADNGEDDGQMIVDTRATTKIALVEELISRYNLLSAEIMKDSRLAFARFLPQLHVLMWGNETGK